MMNELTARRALATLLEKEGEPVAVKVVEPTAGA